jgi:hypothetical protein
MLPRRIPGQNRSICAMWSRENALSDVDVGKDFRSIIGGARTVEMHPIDIVFAGLAFDLAGAVVLAKGFMFKRWDDARVESLTIASANSHYIRSALLQRVEAIVGATLLAVGYALQMWGNLHGGVEASQLGSVNTTGRLALLCASVWALSWLCWRVAIACADAGWYRRMCSNPYTPIAWKPEADESQIARQVQLLRMRRQHGETDDAVRARIERRRVTLWAKHGRVTRG